MRKPNTNCAHCGKEIYRRPIELEKFNNVFCSQICNGEYNRRYKKCAICKEEFKAEKPTSRYCSKKCANVGRTGLKYKKNKSQNHTQRRMQILKEQFEFSCCMVQGCTYNKTYDIHRLKEGKDGGKYELGNMFAICPNHHAEIHRGIIDVEKVDNQTLKIRGSSLVKTNSLMDLDGLRTVPYT